MEIKRLILIAVFILLPFAQVLLLAERVNAACCPCGMCFSGCTCPGKSEHCDACGAPNYDLETIPSLDLSEDPGSTLNIRSVQASVLSIATERMLAEIDRNNGLETVALRLFEKVEVDLKPWCPNAYVRNLQYNTQGSK